MKKNKYRVVFDANVLVSALPFKNSKPRKAFDKALDVGEIIISIPVQTELNKVLNCIGERGVLGFTIQKSRVLKNQAT